MPSEAWKNGVGSALTAYAADQTDANWDKVVTAFVDGWATEAATAKETVNISVPCKKKTIYRHFSGSDHSRCCIYGSKRIQRKRRMCL